MQNRTFCSLFPHSRNRSPIPAYPALNPSLPEDGRRNNSGKGYQHNSGPSLPRGPLALPKQQKPAECFFQECMARAWRYSTGKTLMNLAAFLQPVAQQAAGAAASGSHVMLINKLEQFRLVGGVQA